MPDVAGPATTAPPVDPVQVAAADPEVFRRLLAQAHGILRHPGLSHEDVVQEALLRALNNRHKFNPDAGSLTAWLGGFVQNVAREYHKKLARSAHSDGEPEQIPDSRSAELDPDLDRQRTLLRKHLATLPDQLRQPVELRHFDELEYDEIASKLNITKATARQRVCRGIQLLRTLVPQEAS